MATAPDRSSGFVNQGALQAGSLGRGSSLDRGAGASHATAHEEQVGFDRFYRRFLTKRPTTGFHFQT